MLVRKCHIISTTCKAPIYSVATFSDWSNIWVVHLPLSRGSIFYIWEYESAGLTANEVIFFFSISYVIRALETGKIPKCYLNLISIQTGDWFKRITEWFSVQISWEFLSSTGLGLRRNSEKKFSYEEKQLDLLSVNCSAQFLLLWVCGVC